MKLSCCLVSAAIACGCSSTGRSGVDLRPSNEAQGQDNAVTNLETQCDRGEAGACSDLAVLLLKGEGSVPDVERAVGLLQKACDPAVATPIARKTTVATHADDELLLWKVYSRACGVLGSLYVEGKGVTLDSHKGRALLEISCGVPGTAEECAWLPGACGTEPDFKARRCEWLPGSKAQVVVGTIVEAQVNALLDAARRDLDNCRYFEHESLSQEPSLELARAALDASRSVMDRSSVSRLEERLQKHLSSVEPSREACFEKTVVSARRGWCAKAAGTILEDVGFRAAKVSATGGHAEVLEVRNVPYQHLLEALDETNFRFVLDSCRYAKIVSLTGSPRTIDLDASTERSSSGESDRSPSTEKGRTRPGKARFLSPEMFCTHVAELACDARSKCCSGEVAPLPRERCVDSARAICWGNWDQPYLFGEVEGTIEDPFDVQTGAALWNGDKAASIVTDLSRIVRSCGTLDRLPSVFDALTGTIRELMLCDGNGLARLCEPDLICLLRDRCVRPGGRGETCWSPGCPSGAYEADCATGLFCEAQSEDEELGQCVPRRIVGARCVDQCECADDHYCDEVEGVCKSITVLGPRVTCGVDDECHTICAPGIGTCMSVYCML